MTSQQNENAVSTTTKNAPRRKSSILAALTLNCNLPIIPTINEPPRVETTEMSTTTTELTSASDAKKKSLRFDTNTLMTHEYDSEEVKETKRRITDEIRRWVIFIICCTWWCSSSMFCGKDGKARKHYKIEKVKMCRRKIF